MSKKILWLTSLMLVLSLVLAACGGATAATEEPVEEPAEEEVETPAEEETEEEATTEMTELIVWADEVRAPIINDLGNQFAAEYGVTLTVQEMGFGDIRDQLAVAGPAGEGPDIIIGAHDWLGQLVTNGLVAPLDLASVSGDFLDAAMNAFVYDGQQYGLPYATENIAFVCNADIVETAPATWDEVMTLAETLEADSGGETTAWTIQTIDPYHYFPLMTSFGGYVFGYDNGYDASDVGLDSEGAIAAASWLQSMVEGGHLSPDMYYGGVPARFTGYQEAGAVTGN